ncbi:MAG: glutamate--tRNA ligase, partial [Candidatus Subteraquimicrobiales bacterium]|nr:glutamate--tRNA ligase [Candidatus Subteraquimicrobiales bacterium]
RFAPSPTGFLHVGGARTALYNWLFARNKKGDFVLRIEDTDRSRSTEEAIEEIVNSMRWLDLSWDEGPYRQTEHLDLYTKEANRLLESNKAYLCYCTPDELRKRRELALKEKRAPRYDGRCRSLKPKEKRNLEESGRKPAIRFDCPKTGETIVNDLIRGRVEFKNEVLDDFIILRADGFPTYNFAVVVDDYSMKITHVIRGEDHLPNTPKQILLYQALEYEIPAFAHLPMILGSDKKPLSKRHGATSVEEFRKIGYLSQAMINYLALLGWSYDEKTTLLSVDELVERFSIERVSKNPAIWDPVKLEWMNGHYIRQMSIDELTDSVLPYLKETGF